MTGRSLECLHDRARGRDRNEGKGQRENKRERIAALGEASGQGGARSAISPELRGSGGRAVVRQGERQREGEVRESFVFLWMRGPTCKCVRERG